MKKLIQNRLHKGMDNLKDRGNCFPTVIACVMDLDSPEDCIQIQEYYDTDEWVGKLNKWLRDRDWELEDIGKHLSDGSYYFVTGESPRGSSHICIYQDGKLWHDPHPDATGLVTEKYFEQLYPISK